MYSVEYTSSAVKDINKLPPEVKKRIFNTVDEIKEDPYEHVKKLKMSAKSPTLFFESGRI
ncbi:MAG: type II toxin-antitoxin system RelE family toxin [Methanosarcina sp.]